MEQYKPDDDHDDCEFGSHTRAHITAQLNKWIIIDDDIQSFSGLTEDCK